MTMGQERNRVVVGQGIVGQPVAYVPGQWVRNSFVSISMNLVSEDLGSKSLTVGLTLTSITTLLLPAVSQSGTRPTVEPEVPHAQLNDCDLAVAIDVLRATSVIVKALASGAESVMTCETIEQRFRLAESEPIVLCVANVIVKRLMDLPWVILRWHIENVHGKRLVLTTTNGTKAIEMASPVPSLAIASFLNLSAVISRILRARHTCIICAGTNGVITSEDVLLAGALVTGIKNVCKAAQFDDASEISASFWESSMNLDPKDSDQSIALQLADRLQRTEGGRNLIGVGYENDFSLQSDQFVTDPADAKSSFSIVFRVDDSAR